MTTLDPWEVSDVHCAADMLFEELEHDAREHGNRRMYAAWKIQRYRFAETLDEHHTLACPWRPRSNEQARRNRSRWETVLLALTNDDATTSDTAVDDAEMQSQRVSTFTQWMNASTPPRR